MSDTLGIDPALQQRVQEIVTSAGKEPIPSKLAEALGGIWQAIPAAASFQGNPIHVETKVICGEVFSGSFSPPAQGPTDGTIYVRRPLRGVYRIRVSINEDYSTVFFRKLLHRDPRLPGEEEPNPAEEPDEQEYVNDPVRVDAVLFAFTGGGLFSGVADAGGSGTWRTAGPVEA
ncbi:hypothetical protein JAAARDRAFT_59944 [Jaapia argillacea MUCL 33604]|uniref:Uncharacterized protein n=1 Tax=Jaapia argillacea MUCL 33604 TaxID=933084 RepID=A0A067PYN9_9AGAM|nr:hypothetical protein JAAARDRAFT_59944 [Jaapia argillacea MUCL 33604]